MTTKKFGLIHPSEDLTSALDYDRVVVRRTANQTIPNLTLTAIIFPSGSATYEYVPATGSQPIHSMSTNSGRFTLPETGLYAVAGAVMFSGSSVSGLRGVRVRHTYNSGGSLRDVTAPVQIAEGFGDTTMQFYVELGATAGEYVEIIASQTSGGNLDILATYTWVSVRRL